MSSLARFSILASLVFWLAPTASRADAFGLKPNVAKLWEKASESEKKEMKGTGFYLLPDPAKGARATQKVQVPGLTYDDAVARSTGTLQATWIPDSILDDEDDDEGKSKCGKECVDFKKDCDESYPGCMFCSDHGDGGVCD